MATASSVSSEKVLTDINEQILLCAICMERFKSPKILPCYHTYCEPCLTEWVKTNNDKLICPTCKELFPLPSGGVSAIDNNRFINDLQQILSDVNPDSEKSLCDVCEKAAKFWCQDCGEFFCDDCVKPHKRMRLLKDHKLMTVGEYTEKMASEHFRLIQPRFCDKHHSTQLEFYCDSCQVPTCYKCTVVEHVPPEHVTISVEAALEKYMPTMKEYEEKAAQKVSDLKQARDGVLDVGKHLEKNKTTAESQVKDLSKIVMDVIQKQENRLLAEIADTYTPKRKQIDSKVEQLEHRLVGAESMHLHLNHLFRYGGAVDIMAAKNEICQRLGQDGLTEENFDSIDSNLDFTENPQCRLVDLGNVNQAEPVFDRITCVYEEVTTDSLQIPKEMQNSFQMLLNETHVQYNFIDDVAIIKGDLAKFEVIYNKLTSMMQESTGANVSNEFMELLGNIRLDDLPLPMSAVITSLNSSSCKWGMKKHTDKMLLMVKGYLNQLIQVNYDLVAMLARHQVGSAIATNLSDDSGNKKVENQDKATQSSLAHSESNLSDLHQGRSQNVSKNIGSRELSNHLQSTEPAKECMENIAATVVNLSQNQSERDSKHTSETTDKRFQKTEVFGSGEAKLNMKDSISNMSDNTRNDDASSKNMKSVNSNEAVAQLPQNDATEVREQDKHFDHKKHDSVQHRTLTVSPPVYKERENKSNTEKTVSNVVTVVTESKSISELPVPRANHDFDPAEEAKGSDNKSNRNHELEVRNNHMTKGGHDTTENRKKVININKHSLSTAQLEKKKEDKPKASSTAVCDHPLVNTDSNVDSSFDWMPELSQNNVEERKDFDTAVEGVSAEGFTEPKVVTLGAANKNIPSHHGSAEIRATHELEKKRANHFNDSKQVNDRMTENSQSQACNTSLYQDKINVSPDLPESGSTSGAKKKGNDEKTEHTVQDSDQKDSGNISHETDNQLDSEAKIDRSTKTTKHPVHSTSTDGKLSCASKPITFEDDQHLLHYAFLVHSQEISELKVKHRVSIDYKDKNPTKVTIIIVPKKSCTNEDAKRVSEDLKGLLKCIEKNLKYGIIDFRGKGIDTTKKTKAMNIIAQFERENMIVRVPVAGKNIVKLCSENQEVLDGTVQKINKTLGIVPPKKDSNVGNADFKDNKTAQPLKNIKEPDLNSKHISGRTEKAEESSNQSGTSSKEGSVTSMNMGSKKGESTDKCETHAVKENQYILQFFYDTYKYEITELSKRYNVRIKWDPSIDAGSINIIPDDDCLAESVELTKRKLKSYFQAIHELIEKEVVDFSHFPDITEKTLQEAQRMLEIYKNDVSFLLTPKGKFVLLSDDKRLLQKAKNVVLSSLGLLSQKSHSVGSSVDKEHSQTQLKETVSDSSKCETDKSTKKATVGEDMLAFMFHVHRESLSDIAKNHHVKFEWNEGHDVVIKPAKDNGQCTEQNLEDAYEVFVSFVQSLHTKMISKEIDLTRKDLSPTRITQAIKVTKATHAKIHIIDGNEQVGILGEVSEVKFATETFCNHLGVNIPQARHGGRRRGGPSGILRSNSADDKADQRRKVLLEFEVGKVRKTKVLVCQGDITKERVDAISNAANEKLDHGGGVAGAIVKAGGYSIQRESDDIIKRMRRPLDIAEAVYTKAGTLPCKWVLHVVSPKWDERNTSKVTEALHNCSINLLSLAESLGAKSVAIPAIGTGIYDVPNYICAKMMYHAVMTYFGSQLSKGKLDEVQFIDIDRNTVTAFTKVFQEELERDGSLYFKPEDFGHDTEIWGCGSSVDGPPYRGKGRGLNQADIKQLNEGQVMHRGNSASSSKGSSNSHGAIPKSSPMASGTDDKTDRSKDLIENTCSICLDDIEDPKELACKHTFCKACIDQSEKVRGPTCPVCKQIFGVLIGDMPEGKMTHRVERVLSLPGFSKCGSIMITYYFPSGYQKEEHPNPGKWYTGTTRTAYLPNNAEGQEVLRLLKIAFDRRLTFTIGTSRTTAGATDIVTWNDIHHKTTIYGGPEGFGYPDPDYLRRVKEELAAKGVK